MLDRCCGGDVDFLLLQINAICLLLAVIGAAAVVKHHAWFDGGTAVQQTMIGR